MTLGRIRDVALILATVGAAAFVVAAITYLS